MPHYLEGLAGSPWLLVVVFAVAGLDAILPFMPSESTVVAVGVVAAGTGRPHLAALIVAAAGGAYLEPCSSRAVAPQGWEVRVATWAELPNLRRCRRRPPAHSFDLPQIREFAAA
jgi:hypothetical protein